MKEKITEVLNDETLETVEDKVNAISKELATLIVPKDKFNEMSGRVKKLEKEKADVETELEDLKNQNLSEDDKSKKEKEDLLKKVKAQALELNKSKAKDIFKDAKIDDEKIEELLVSVVSEDEKSTIALANSFADILKAKVDETQKQTQTNLLENTPKPNVKAQPNAPKKYTKEDFIKMSYSEKKALFLQDKEQYTNLESEVSTQE